MLEALIVGLSFAAGALLAVAAMTPAAATPLARRLQEIHGPGAAGAQPEELTLPFTERVVRPLVESGLRALGRLLPRALVDTARRRLDEAGLRIDPARFVGLQAALATLGVLGGLLLGLDRLLAGAPLLPAVLASSLGVLGWRLPGVWAARRGAWRRRMLARALPDVLDLLSVSVEAGLGFDGAVQKVAEKFPEPVSGEFREYLRDIRLGQTRADALRALADRSGSPELRTFVAAVVQADQLGVSISRVLKAQSDAMRLRRKQRAEERAMQLPLKLLFPLVFFIFPSLFVVILGPVVIQFLGVLRP
ncbi:type II secretion system F family protein [Caldinitratiruptor microaerophilus]|uniref:Type II secretion system protein n=1 Tax=Caldinitratiruptor microaerophilus TaxID=671077 RepID=A0AA35G9F7_9FIRM|nr:type II secretion system F family protein [Caldinitratiruptor microaerophilus]BDG60244.1 type II secretion system protein [Caldinitratiruptor microaerophilus]